MEWNEQILKKNDIEQLYLDLINEYGQKLPPNEKEVARKLFLELHQKGKSWEWMYWAVWQLGERRIINNKGLFFYPNYQKEVEEIAKNANEYIFAKLTLEQYMEDYVQYLVLFEKNNMDARLHERLSYFDDKYWNTEEEFKEEEMEELIFYYKEMLKDLLRTSRAEYELEQKSIASELRRVFGRIVDVPPHPFVDMQFYKTEPTEEQKKLGLQLGLYKE